MKEEIRFPIYRKCGPKSRPFGPELDDANFDIVSSLAVELGLTMRPPRPGSTSFSVVCDKQTSKLEILLKKLESIGWKASRNHVLAGEKEIFQIGATRTYSRDDIEASELLAVDSFGNCCSGTHSEHGWTGFTDSMESWDRPVISFGLFTYFVSDSVKEALERANMAGIDFSKLSWDNPEKEMTRFWELRSNAQMPPSLLPTVDTGDNFLFYFEEGYTLPALSFSRSDVDKMKYFDAAFCCERIGNDQKEDMGKHMLVVSQEFREIFKHLLIAEQINFLPVRLQ